MNFKVGDYVTWIDNGPDHHGSLWHGINLNPKGYRVLKIERGQLLVETISGRSEYSSPRYFGLVKPRIKRNLPTWW